MTTSSEGRGVENGPSRNRHGFLGALIATALLAAFLPPSVGAAPTGEVSVWHMDEGKGTLIGSDTAPELTGYATQSDMWTPGIDGSALDFGGQGPAQVSVNDSGGRLMANGDGEFTLSLWVQASTTPSIGDEWAILSRLDGSGVGYQLMQLPTGHLRFDHIVEAGTYSTTSTGATVSDGKWHHVALVTNGDRRTLHIDSTRTFVNEVAGTADLTSNSANFMLGLTGGGKGALYEGKIDEIYAYSAALTPAEIHDLYDDHVVVPIDPIINSTDDDPDTTPGDGVCDTGQLNTVATIECTLRAAIEEANSNPDETTISFDIPAADLGHSAGVWTIQPASALPTLTEATLLDARTQTGWVDAPVLTLDGSTVGGSGLSIRGDNSLVAGFAIGNFSDHGIAIAATAGAIVRDNYIGLAPDGSTPTPNKQSGVHIIDSNSITVGSSLAGWRGGNVISGNGGSGITVINSPETTIDNNLIGVDSTRSTTVGNAQHGIHLDAGGSTVVGTAGRGNVIGGNLRDGINLTAPSAANSTLIRSNEIGIALFRGVVSNGGSGIFIEASSGGLTYISQNSIAHNDGDGIEVASSVTGLTGSASNVIWMNGGEGIDLGADGPTPNDAGDGDAGPNGYLNFPEILAVTPTAVADEYLVEYALDMPAAAYVVNFYTSPSGTDPGGFGEGESRQGFAVETHPGGQVNYSTTVGGLAPGDVLTTLVHGNGGTSNITSEFSGQFVVGPPVPSTAVVNSTADLDDVDLNDGVCDTGELNSANQPECTLRGAITQMNHLPGANSIHFDIPLSDPGRSTSVAVPNIWTIAVGTEDGTNFPRVTSQTDIDATTQPGWTDDPIIVVDGILTASGSDGFEFGLGSEDSTLRGLSIVNFPDDAAWTSSSNVTFADNFVGVLPDGTIGGNGDGLVAWSSATATVIGGSAADGNLIQFNSGNGIHITDAGTSNTTVSHNTVRENGYGIRVASGAEVVAISDNMIANNALDGVVLQTITDVTISKNQLIDNQTGVRSIGTNSTTLIGGPTTAEANTITGGDSGIVIADTFAPSTIEIMSNSIYDQAVIGIDLGDDGPDVNDPGDTDTGANLGLNTPVIVSAVDNGTHTILDLEFDTETISRDYVVELFRSKANGSTPDAQARIGQSLITGGSGLIQRRITFGSVADSEYTATLTNVTAGSPRFTSEISAAVVPNMINDLDNPGDQLSSEADVVSLQLVAVQGGTAPLSYSAFGLPAGLTIDSVTGHISGTLGYESAGASSVNVSVTSEDAGTDWESFTWTVDNVNRTSDLAFPDRTDAENATVTWTPSATDPDGDPLTWSAAGLPTGLTMDPTTGEVTGTISNDAARTYLTEITVDDGTSPVSAGFAWYITDVNRQPTIASPGDLVSEEGDTISITIMGSDPDGDDLTWTATALPPGLAIDPATGEISGGPLSFTSAGTYASQVSADDGGSPISINFAWDVTDVNRAPVLDSPGTITSNEGSTLSIALTGSDPDGDILTWAASGLPSGVSIDSASGVIGGTIGFDAAGPYTPQVTVDDGTTTASIGFVWNVTNQNRLPVIAPIPNQTNDVGDVVSLQTAASDPDGDALSWSAIGLPTGITINPTSGEIYGVPATEQTTIAYISAEDPNGGTDTETLTWVVSTVPPPTTTTTPATTTTTTPTTTTTTTPATTTTTTPATTTTSPSTTATTSASTTNTTSTSTIAPTTPTTATSPSTTDAADTARSTTLTPPTEIAPPESVPSGLPYVPVAAFDDRTAISTNRATVDVLSNDSFGESPRISAVSQPSAGSVEIVGDKIELTMPPSFAGDLTFSYTITDESGAESSAQVKVFSANVLAPAGELVQPQQDIRTISEIFGRVTTLFSGLIRIRLSTIQLSALATGPLLFGLLRFLFVRREDLVSLTGMRRTQPVALATENGQFNLRHDALLWSTRRRSKLPGEGTKTAVELPNGEQAWVDSDLIADTGF